MMERKTRLKRIKQYSLLLVGSLVSLLVTTPTNKVEGAGLGGPTHIGTFEGSTTFTTSSSNGVNPGLFIEVMDEYGNLSQYESEEGLITVPNTKEGAYVTQAKLFGKTMYKDRDTGELLDTWEEGRNLELLSVENPELKTVGKNLFDMNAAEEGFLSIDQPYNLMPPDHSNKTSVYIRVKPNTQYTYSFDGFSTDEIGGFYWTGMYAYQDIGVVSVENSSRNVWSGKSDSLKTITFTTPSDCYYIRIGSRGLMLDGAVAQLEESSVATSYVSYNSNLLNIQEDVVLRGIREVRDELDLITGELAKNINELVLDGNRDYVYSGNHVTNDEYVTFHTFLEENQKPSANWRLGVSDKFEVNNEAGLGVYTKECIYPNNNFNVVYIRVKKSRLVELTPNGFKKWVSDNPITIQYGLATPIIENVFLDSTYYFQPVMNRDVYVDGSILPLVCSVTIPTESLAFVLNPNAEAGQQFIAPEFTVVNHTPTSIYLELKRFEQLTTVMNDVLPEAHEDWSQLNREQSKDIALALVPKPSEGWLNLEEGPRYVADDSNYYLGEVKAESSVDFTFIASHGRAFVEPMDPKYRLSFVFDFFE